MQGNAEFKRRFTALMRKSGDKAETVARKVAIELQNSMILKSPVDTGRFRANWVCGVGMVNAAVTDKLDPTGSGALQKTVIALDGFKAGQTINLTNSLPYSMRLEYGWSKQAPGGMVRLTLQEYSQHLKKVVSELK